MDAKYLNVISTSQRSGHMIECKIPFILKTHVYITVDFFKKFLGGTETKSNYTLSLNNGLCVLIHGNSDPVILSNCSLWTVKEESLILTR